MYANNDPAALYRADTAPRQRMRLHEADSDVAVYQEIRLQGRDDTMSCAIICMMERYHREWVQGVTLLVRQGLNVVKDGKAKPKREG